LLGFVFLGESLLANQIFGGSLIFIGAFALSLNLEGGKWSFRKRVASLMILASLLYAVNSVVFKFFALDLGFWPSLFWDSVGKVLMGAAFFLLVRNYRRDFVATIKQNKASVFLLNSTSETLTILADSISGYAILLAPIALVSVVLSGFQPVFVFLIGVVLTLLLPRLGKETLTKRSLAQRVVALLLILAGTYFLG
jgi:drug/metabolite transporter (DMT)-like permease